MSTGTQIALGVGIALVIFVSVLALRRREPKPPRQEREISQEALAQAKELVADGWKIKAIKVIRDDTGMTLKEAKEYAEALDTGEPPVRRPVDGLSEETVARARALVAEGKLIMAVKIIRDETGWPLKRCKDITDRMKTKPEQPDDSYWQLGQNP